MTAALLALLLLAAQGATPAAAQQGSCAVCHGAEGRGLSLGVHARVGVGCVDCHGGQVDTLDQEAAHGAQLRVLRDPAASVEACARCHSDLERMRAFGLRTDQASLYWTSQHGRRLAESGDAGVATCVSCHGAHDVFPVSDPRSAAHPLNQAQSCGRCHADPELMGRYGLSAAIVDEYRSSIHGRVLLEESFLSGPACSDCHGSHGATPPRVEEVGQTCGNCHSVVQEYFEQSPHLAASLEGSLDECVSCHANHATSEASAAMLVGQGPGHCATCHADADDPGRARALELHEGLSRLDARIRTAEERVREAAARGLFIEREHGYLDDARSMRIRARALTHALDPALLDDLLNRSEAMIQQTDEAVGLKERALRDRRIFSAVFLLVSLLLAGVMQVYRREAFPRWKPPGQGRGT